MRASSIQRGRAVKFLSTLVVSAACETPLVYDLGNEDDEAVVVLGHGGAAAYCELAPKHVPKYARGGSTPRPTRRSWRSSTRPLRPCAASCAAR